MLGTQAVLSSDQIRAGFIEFFKSKGHQFVPSSPIIPQDDQTLLFTNAGMNQFKDIFVGLRVPEFRRAVNSQKCLRVSGKHNDLEQVGKDTYHHTFFEMLGNWSFGDYFKAEAIAWAWELLTEVWGIDPQRLWATVFAGDPEEGLPKDSEAAELWPKVTPIRPEQVLAFGKKDNFWEMGPTGPCGPCSEIHIDLGPDRCDRQHDSNHRCGVNAGCSRFIELWNLVFIQYNRDEHGRLQALGAKYVDTGAGLERVAATLQGKYSNYDTDLFAPIIEAISRITGRKYTGALNNATDNAFRVIADHIRALTFAVTDGGIPSNDGRGYVIRRILRRAARFGRELAMHQPFIYKLVPVVVECLGGAFPEIKDRAEYVSTVIKSEEESFGRTLDRGIEIFSQAAERARSAANKTISGEDAFRLYDTYGFPLDLTELMAREQGLKVDSAGFEQLMQRQRERARAAQKTDAVAANVVDGELPRTDDGPKYHGRRCEAKVVGFLDQTGFRDTGSIESGVDSAVVLDRTCFYAESGGQVGDSGEIRSATGRFAVETTVKLGDCVVHKGKVVEGALSVGQQAEAIVSKDRDATRKNHTATHLLQWALRQVLGGSVTQQGSLVCPQYLRFDFTCPGAPTRQQLEQVERLVREKISADEPVTCAVMPRAQAEKVGAMALFGEKYGSEVRVVAVGAEGQDRVEQAFSKEFCGGTHVERTGVIGGFKIIKQESIAAGVRRITALTGQALAEYLDRQSSIVEELSHRLKVPPESLPQRVEQLLEENKKLARQLKSASKGRGDEVIAQARALLDKLQRVGSAAIITGRLTGGSVEQARAAIDMLKKKAGSAAVVLGFEQDAKAVLLAGVTEDLIRKGVKAGDIVRTIAAIVEGGGGGQAHMAQAGGKRPEKLDEALAAAGQLLRQKIGEIS